LTNERTLSAVPSRILINSSRCDTTPHSGGNDRFCARLKTDISAFSSGLQGHLRSCFTISDSSRRPLSKNVRHNLVRPRRPELEAEMSVFNLAQKRSFPPLCTGSQQLQSAFFLGGGYHSRRSPFQVLTVPMLLHFCTQIERTGVSTSLGCWLWNLVCFVWSDNLVRTLM
jgi:hypothetical protein